MRKAENMHRHSIRYNGIQDVAQRNISRKHAAFICHEKAILYVSNAMLSKYRELSDDVFFF